MPGKNFNNLAYAIEINNDEAAKILIENKANPSMKTYYKTNKVYYDIITDDEEKSQYISGKVSQSGERYDFEKTSDEKYFYTTPLHLAASSGNNDIIKLMEEKSGDKFLIKSTDKNGKTPLDIAKEKGFGETVALLKSYELS